MKPTLILGLGNLLQGDDGVGCRVAQELEKIIIARHGVGAEAISQSTLKDCFAPLAMTRLPDTVEVIDGGTPGIGLLNLFEGRECVIIIDAAEMGLPPGEFRRFEPREVTLTGSKDRFSLHRTGVMDALALARELKIELPRIVFFGVQPAIVDWSDALSPAVQAAMPGLIEVIVNEVKL